VIRTCAAVAAAGVLLTASCTSETKKTTASPAPNTARQQLAALASKTAAAAYDATYDFEARTAGGKGTLRIVAMPPTRYRLDVVSGGKTAQFYDVEAGVVSCALKPGAPTTCVLVAKKGEPVPDIFDPGVQHLFTTGPKALADNPDGYDVRSLPDAPAVAGLPAGKCFHVERLADLQTLSPGTVTPPGEGFESGDYCFDPASGVLTSAKVTSGTLTLSKLGPAPTAAEFEPPAKPVPLPSTSATPTASPS
jgi:hypothetical protein